MKIESYLALLITSVLLLACVYYYHPDASLAFVSAQQLLFLIIPLVIIIFGFRQLPRQYGLSIGDYKQGLLYVAVAMGIVLPVLLITARLPSIHGFYSPYAENDILLLLADLFAWEFLCRGFFLFGLMRTIKPSYAIWVQAVLFTLMHLGKPEIETYSTIITGPLFGYIAYKTSSMIYPWMIHSAILLSTIYASNM